MSEYGHFSEHEQSFVITTRDIPRHWYNYLWNDTYISFISQVGFGEGFAQDSMGRRVPLVGDRKVYMLDAASGEYWTANGLPVYKEYDHYQCIHGLGYSEIRLEYKGIASSYRVFVPNAGNYEIWTVKLRNNRQTAAVIKVIPYFSTDLDGAYKPQGYNLATGSYDKKRQAVVGRSFKSFESANNREVYGYLLGFNHITGYDSRQTAFIGTYGEELSPKALMEHKGCTNSDCIAEKLCFALESTVELAAGEEREFSFIAGIAFSMDEIEQQKSEFSDPNRIDHAFNEVKAKFSSEIADVTVDTPDSNLNHLFTWLKHQANMGSRWARVRHNGYRDLVSDCECLGAVNPDLAWERLKRVLSYQYSNGYAPRTFLDGSVKDHNFADCTVWLTFAVYSLLKEKGDLTMLEEIVSFNDGTEASVYEHISRSVEFLWNFRGLHGLIKIWGGDWNDCMNQAGLQGQGVSVWLSIAWYRANRQFAEIARLKGCTAEAERADAQAEEMKEIVDRYGWDGHYYLAAYTDEGKKIGAAECEEGKIYLISQLWAVLSGISTGDKAVQAMKAVDHYLETELGTLVSWPAYTKQQQDIGTMTEKPAGVHENGGVYLHPASWKLAVDSLLKQPDKVQKGLWNILPFYKDGSHKKCEPYIMSNSYFTEATGYRYGTAGQSWRTATGAWLMKALVNYVFGLRPEMEGLAIDPCLPPDWKTCSITKRFRGAEYRITYEQAAEAAVNGNKQVLVNDEVWLSDILPYKGGEKYNIKVISG